jgi:hypothetical protein
MIGDVSDLGSCPRIGDVSDLGSCPRIRDVSDLGSCPRILFVICGLERLRCATRMLPLF